MKKCWIKKIGRQGRINLAANKILKDKYYLLGVNSCEIKLQGCLGGFTIAPAHRHRRWFYIKQPELLSDINQSVLACQNCHEKIDNNKELLEKVFDKLRK